VLDAAPAIDAAIDAVPAGPATVILNELGPDFPDSHDLIELLVTTAGTTKGIHLEKFYPHAPVVLATLPDVVVATNDLIVDHMSPATAAGKAQTTAAVEQRTADTFAGGWDFLGEEDDDPFAFVGLAVPDAAGKVTSAVPFFHSNTSRLDQKPREFPADVQA